MAGWRCKLKPRLCHEITDCGSQAAFRSSVETTLLLVAGFAGLTIVGVVAIGPQVMQIAVGDTFEYDQLGLAIVAEIVDRYKGRIEITNSTLGGARVIASFPLA